MQSNSVCCKLVNFGIFVLNIRSLRKHYDELCIYLQSLKQTYYLIILTEVWIKSGEEDKYQLPGYDMLLQPRPDGRAGGVCVYVEATMRYSYQLILLPTAEVISVAVNVVHNNNNLQITVFGVYRQCKFTFNQFQSDLENILSKTSNPTIITGDMNICLLKNNNSSTKYLNLISAFGFESLINIPTRVVNNSQTCIDHVLLRNALPLNVECNVVDLNITDHNALNISISEICCITERPKYCKLVNYKMLRRQLQLASWDDVYNVNNVDLSVSNFYKIYNSCYVSSCTLKKLNSKSRKRNVWVTDNLVQIINRKNYLYKEYCKNKFNLALRNEYNNFSKYVTGEIRRAKLSYYSALIDNCKGDSRKYWNVIKGIIKNKKSSLVTIRINGNPVDVNGNEFLVASEFNNYYTSVVSELKNKAFGCDMFMENCNNENELFSNFNCTYLDVVNSVMSIKDKRSTGVDGISILTVKKNLDIFAPLLYNMFKKSLEQGRVPDEFKLATVVPIYKSADKSEVSSYRPISVISVIAKIFEKIIKNKILDFFTQRSIFSGNQYGFIPGRGIDLAVEKHVSLIASASDKYKHTVAVYLDFQKAFDVLDINVLLNKFRKYGFCGLALSWLKSFCIGRKQVVKINNVISDPLELYFGTAQGGVLGPIMFLVYINDLLELDMYSTVFAYADDTALVCSADNKQSLQLKIRKDLDKVSHWLSTNRLLINSTKSKCIVFYDYHLTNDHLQQEFNLMCHNHQCIYNCTCSNIEVVDYVKYLGMYIDKRLKWDHHINVLSSKLRKVNYVLYHLKSFVKSDQLLNVYLSWFESLMRFGIIHYGGAYNSCLNSVIMNQRHAVRTIYNVKRKDRMSYLFKEKDILTFEQLHKYSIILYISKFIYNFDFRESNRETRSSQQLALKVPFLTKESSRHQFCYLGPRIYNNFIIHCGESVLFEKKPKVKMKALEYLKHMPVVA